MKKLTTLYLSSFLVLATSIISCEDLDIENLNQPDAERALSSDADLISLIDGSVTDLFSDLIGFYGIYLDGLADQITSTNAYADFWLMSTCNHFIIANSTFSWWASWLNNSPNKLILHPNSQQKKNIFLGT